MNPLARIAAALTLGTLSLNSFAQSTDPEAILKSLGETRQEAYAQASKEGRQVDQAALEKQLVEAAKKAVEGVDVAKVAPRDAFAWSQVFRTAGMKPESVTLAEKAAKHNATIAWQAQQVLLDAYLTEGRYDKVLETLDFMTFANVSMLGQAGEWVAFGLAPKVQDSNPQLALDAFDLLTRRIDLKRPMSESDKSWATFAAARTGAHRAGVLYKMGKHQEALSALKGLKARYGHDKRAGDDLNQALNQLSASNRPATEIKFDRQLGGFAGLSRLKGKVVVLDFFAHWCGPCIRGFPGLRELYANLKPRGLEVVGVTGYYGYYGAKQGISKDEEFSLMKKFVADKGVTWPVAFTDGSASAAYGVSVIPHVVVIDRKGIVRNVQIGTTPESHAQLRRTVEKYLAE